MPFYEALLGYFEYRLVMGTSHLMGMSNGTTDFWIVQTTGERVGAGCHRKDPGLNHVAFRGGRREDVLRASSVDAP